MKNTKKLKALRKSSQKNSKKKNRTVVKSIREKKLEKALKRKETALKRAERKAERNAKALKEERLARRRERAFAKRRAERKAERDRKKRAEERAKVRKRAARKKREAVRAMITPETAALKVLKRRGKEILKRYLARVGEAMNLLGFMSEAWYPVAAKLWGMTERDMYTHIFSPGVGEVEAA
jgi:hypothetical protein